jgi:riboflavin synthase
VFTGIIQDVGQVRGVDHRGGDLRLQIATEKLELAQQSIGDSIAVAGVCLTVVGLGRDEFSVDVSGETLNLTTVGAWRVGTRLNLEAALRAGSALGGHLVAGHIDGMAELAHRSSDARSERIGVRVPQQLVRYVARKGSVTLDGVSLTVNAIEGNVVGINLVPHTLAVTTLGALEVGDKINLEVDIIARYVERLISERDP